MQYCGSYNKTSCSDIGVISIIFYRFYDLYVGVFLVFIFDFFVLKAIKTYHKALFLVTLKCQNNNFNVVVVFLEFGVLKF